MASLPVAALEVDRQLAAEMAKYYADPLGFVLCAFPWGRVGTSLAQASGPDTWQRELLLDIGAAVAERRFDGHTAVAALRYAVASGHGIGKSTIVAWLVCWLMATRINCVGTITANTFPQLSTKTWAAIQRWMRLSITAHWWIVTGDQIRHKDYGETWYCTAQTCREENSESFAGQHAATSTSFYFFDEASAIPEKIWEVAEGGLTDGSPMIFAFGNPTRNTGKFYRLCFGSERARWTHRSIDSRTSSLTNKTLIAEWIADHGEDSDFVRVRVRGLPPRASELQFIDQERIYKAQAREAQHLDDDPVIAGVDISGGGAAWNTVHFRQGNDARSRPPLRLTGERGTREVMIAQLAQLLGETDPAKKIDMMFVDSAFGSPIVERLHVMGYRNVAEVVFGEKAPDHHYANMRAYMWNGMKEWLQRGAIAKDDERLEIDLMNPGYHFNTQSELVLESKEQMQKRGVASPDCADALALTFAARVAPRKPPEAQRAVEYDPSYAGQDWMS